ncbi:hypothetical protein PIB30_056332 [Stylosanthes scabra]|uniref:Uncharacterized protein n=1 Tax=Stylosanthes scabra TaxID=79078 RepID=A0ABU6UK75_9FABA|nr:hypothetical protein [Stylosanthes scabra]
MYLNNFNGTDSFKKLGELGAVNGERKVANEELEVKGEGAVASASIVAFFQDLRHSLSLLINEHISEHLPTSSLSITRCYRNSSSDLVFFIFVSRGEQFRSIYQHLLFPSPDAIAIAAPTAIYFHHWRARSSSSPVICLCILNQHSIYVYSTMMVCSVHFKFHED